MLEDTEYPWSALLAGSQTRRALWRQLADVIEQHTTHVDELRVAPRLDPDAIRRTLAPCDFSRPMSPADAVAFAAAGLTEYQVHTPHPRYYGLFNPAPTMMGIAGDTLAAAFNPQMAAWSHSPFAVEVERHLVRALGVRFGYDESSVDGAFASGGAEANHTALLVALSAAFPEFALQGVRGLASQPVLYVSGEAHHSFRKAARMCGLGANAVREIDVDAGLRLRPDRLESAIAADRDAGLAPFFIAATAGTTNAGAIDPLPECAEIAARNGLWFHTDAAWGGAAALVPELAPLLAGIERADSITFDAHKWLSVPMGAGLFLTRHVDAMDRAFSMRTAYMPRDAAGLDIVDPHLHTMQWSRRFIGLKVFLSLLVAGWDGYARAIRHQTAMGDLLRQGLASAGWRLDNDTPLPVVCFSDPGGADAHAIAMEIVASGAAWISTTLLAGARTVIRACITNYRTTPEDVAALVGALGRAREKTVHAAPAETSTGA
jgi:glutamate/tyrosine decarboxylase-like PLP-dependent enzyme